MYLGAHMLRSIVRTVLLALTFAGGGVFFSLAHAAFPSYTTKWRYVGFSPVFDTPLAACQSRPTLVGIQYRENAGAIGGYDYQCVTNTGALSGETRRTSVEAWCPTNSSLAGGSCTCSSGFVEVSNPYEPEKTSCGEAPACTVGQARTVNITTGWARSSRPDAADLVSDFGLPPLYDYNDGECVGNIASVDSCWRSQEPHANGLYRESCDFTMIMTGDASAPGDPNADPLNSEPGCPGFLGEINGKPACVGTASSPLPSDPRPSGAPSSQPGNPTAGLKPSDGEGSGDTGSGRTPSVGDGGNGGGPASSAVRPGYTAPTPGEDNGQPCGGPGQPVCAVKVDETGTPTSAAGIFDGAGSGVDEQSGILSGLLDTIESWDIGSWTWTFALPTGCTPLETYLDVVIDPCQWMAEVHDIMSVLWILTGIAGLFVIYSRAF